MFVLFIETAKMALRSIVLLFRDSFFLRLLEVQSGRTCCWWTSIRRRIGRTQRRTTPRKGRQHTGAILFFFGGGGGYFFILPHHVRFQSFAVAPTTPAVGR